MHSTGHLPREVAFICLKWRSTARIVDKGQMGEQVDVSLSFLPLALALSPPLSYSTLQHRRLTPVLRSLTLTTDSFNVELETHISPWTHLLTSKGLPRSVVLRARVLPADRPQYADDDSTSMYSAMPSLSNASRSHAEPARTEVGLAIEDLSIDGHLGPNGRGRESQGDDEFEEGQQPFGQNVEHACW